MLQANGVDEKDWGLMPGDWKVRFGNLKLNSSATHFGVEFGDIDLVNKGLLLATSLLVVSSPFYSYHTS